MQRLLSVCARGRPGRPRALRLRLVQRPSVRLWLALVARLLQNSQLREVIAYALSASGMLRCVRVRAAFLLQLLVSARPVSGAACAL